MKQHFIISVCIASLTVHIHAMEQQRPIQEQSSSWLARTKNQITHKINPENWDDATVLDASSICTGIGVGNSVACPLAITTAAPCIISASPLISFTAILGLSSLCFIPCIVTADALNEEALSRMPINKKRHKIRMNKED